MSFGCPFWIWYNALPVASLLVSEYSWNYPCLSGRCKTGVLCSLCLISSKACCCSFSQRSCLPFLVRSYMGFKSFWSSGQNKLTKFTIPAKLRQPLIIVGGFSFWIASIQLLNGLTHTLLFLINIVLPMYWRSVLNSWHFFGEIFKPFLHKAFHRSSSFSKCDDFVGVKSNRSSIIASQYFLLCKQFNIAIYIGLPNRRGDVQSHRHHLIHNRKGFWNKEVCHRISLNFQSVIRNGKHPLSQVLTWPCT